MFSSNTSQVAVIATQAEAVDFDGTNDYLTRASNLTGNTDGKTLTFSGWLWGYAQSNTFYAAGPGSEFFIICDASSGSLVFRVQGSDVLGNTILDVRVTAGLAPTLTWTHFLISIDLSNVAKRYIYINDVLTDPSWVDFQNETMDRSFSTYKIGYNPSSLAYLKGRMSNIFLDYTYRDLSITANRRLFVTADLKPAAGQAALNPIIYFPMSDPTTVATNSGTGGNFTLTGTIARSGRGPNQYNAPYSDLDGSADYLSRTTALTGIADGKAFTLSFCFNKDSASNKFPFTIYSNTTKRFRVIVDSGGYITVEAFSSAGSTVLYVESSVGSIALNRNYVITVSVDLTDTAKRHLYINGSAATATWSTYSNTDIDFNPATPRYYAGYDANPANYWDGRLGAVWFNTSYIDLSVAANLAKFVTGTGIDAKPVDLGATGELPTGTSPLIYLPMYGGYNAQRNYGTGGNFTANSDPYTGARGPNEFWGNWADFVPTDYLLKSGALSGVSNGKTFSFSVWVRPDTLTGARTIFCFYNGTALRFELRFAATQFVITARNSSNTTILSAGTGTVFATATQYCIQGCIDLSNSSNRKIYVNGALDSTTWTTYTNADINFASSTNEAIGVSYANSSSDEYDGKIGELYWTTNYIDFSLEANRLLFRDCFGNPTDLPSAITAATVPTPAIYMRFPPTSFGTNSGTGGDFTVTATPLDGGQF
jgi:hypothetical protein